MHNVRRSRRAIIDTVTSELPGKADWIVFGVCASTFNAGKNNTNDKQLN